MVFKRIVSIEWFSSSINPIGLLKPIESIMNRDGLPSYSQLSQCDSRVFRGSGASVGHHYKNFHIHGSWYRG